MNELKGLAESSQFLYEYPAYLVMHLSKATMMRFEAVGRAINAPANHVLYKSGDRPSGCYLIKEGRVKAYEFTATGEENIYNFTDDGALLMEPSTLLNEPLTISFITLTPSKLIFIPREKLVEEIYNTPGVAMDLLCSLSSKFLSVSEQIRESACHSAEWNFCNLLLIFAYKYGVDYDGKVLINEKISQQMLANMLRVSRMTAVRALKRLRDLGLVELINGYYCIRSIDKLKRHMANCELQVY